MRRALEALRGWAGEGRMLAGGVEVDYIVITEDRTEAQAVAAKVETSEEKVKETVEEAVEVVLGRVVEAAVVVEEFELEASTVEEMDATQTTAIGNEKPPGGADKR